MHNLPERFKLTHEFKSKAANVYFYETLVIVEVHEGVNLNFKTGFSALLYALQVLKTKNWVYISNRINSYSVTPTDYKYLNNVPSLKGIAIVNKDYIGIENAKMEATFSKKPFVIFNTLLEAVLWAEEKIL